MHHSWPSEWELTTLENMAQVSTGCPYRIFDYEQNGLNEVQVISRIGDAGMELSEPKFMKISEREMVKYKLKEHDLIFAHRTSPRQLGKILRFYLKATMVIHTANFIRIRANSHQDSVLIESALMLYRSHGYFTKLASAHPNLQSLSIAQVKAIKIPLVNPDVLREPIEQLY